MSLVFITSFSNCWSISGGDLGEDMGMDIDVGRIKGKYITKKGFNLLPFVCMYVLVSYLMLISYTTETIQERMNVCMYVCRSSCCSRDRGEERT